MAEKTIVDKAAFVVGFGIAAVSDAADAIKTAVGVAVTSVGEVLNKEQAKKATQKGPAKKAAEKAPKKAVAKKSPAKGAAKKTAVKKYPAKKAAKKAPAKKAAKKSATNPVKQAGRLRR